MFFGGKLGLRGEIGFGGKDRDFWGGKQRLWGDKWGFPGKK